MNFRWQIIVTLLLITGATGCSRFRELTRRDYALLRDPFTSRSSAENEVADSVERSSGGTGQVSINDTATATAAADYDADAKSNTAGDSRLDEIRVSGRGDVAAARGPSLSDFIGKRPDPSQMPSLKYPDAAASESGFGPFAGQGAAAAARNVAAAEVDDDFTVWASSQNEEWSSSAGQTVGLPASAQIQQVNQVSNSTISADDELPTLPSPDFGNFQPRATDTATPLIRPTASNVVTSAHETSKHPPVGRGDPFANSASRVNVRTLPQRQVPVEAPIFDVPVSSATSAANPFTEFDPSKDSAMNPFATAAANGKSAPGASVDSTFHFDTGWKPSNLVRP